MARKCERTGRWQAGVRCGRGPGRKAGCVGWGRTAKEYECPAQAGTLSRKQGGNDENGCPAQWGGGMGEEQDTSQGVPA